MREKMAVYVDSLCDWGWNIRGVRTQSCHMFSDEMDLDALHSMAVAIGMKREWFQDKERATHYNLIQGRRQAAIVAGAIPVDRRSAVAIWRLQRERAGK
jgi:hypothetical protein